MTSLLTGPFRPALNGWPSVFPVRVLGATLLSLVLFAAMLSLPLSITATVCPDLESAAATASRLSSNRSLGLLLHLNSTIARTQPPLNPEVWQQTSQKTFVFIGGLHRSGTSLLSLIVSQLPDFSGFHDTTAPEDEGQHLQTVFPPARDLVKPAALKKNQSVTAPHLPRLAPEVTLPYILFVTAPGAHLTEREVTANSVGKLWNQWQQYWDLQSPFLVEKSPPNIVRTRYLHASFPNSKFLLIMRHPLPVSLNLVRLSAVEQLERTYRHILHFLYTWTFFVPADLGLLPAALIMRMEDLLVESCTFIPQIEEFLRRSDPRPLATSPLTQLRRATTELDQRLPRRRGGRELLTFHGSRDSALTALNPEEATDWIPDWEKTLETARAADPAAVARFAAQTAPFATLLAHFGYSLHPPYLTRPPHILAAFPSANLTFW